MFFNFDIVNLDKIPLVIVNKDNEEIYKLDPYFCPLVTRVEIHSFVKKERYDTIFVLRRQEGMLIREPDANVIYVRKISSDKKGKLCMKVRYEVFEELYKIASEKKIKLMRKLRDQQKKLYQKEKNNESNGD